MSCSLTSGIVASGPLQGSSTRGWSRRGSNDKGGVSAYGRVESDLRKLLGDTGAAAVTTLIDYYGLPADFPGLTTLPQGTPQQRVGHVQAVWEQRMDNRRFHAHLALHEFEALLFSDPAEIARTLIRPDLAASLQAIRDGHATPEDIDEGPETAPSKRLLQLAPRYRKTHHGPLIASRIGLESIRNQCPHFARWLTWLERLAGAPESP